MLIWRHSICSLTSLHWLHPKASDHPLRSDSGSCSLGIWGFTDPKNIYIITSLCREKATVVVRSGGTPRGYLLAGTRDLSNSCWKAPSVQLLPAPQLLGTRITLMWDTTDAPSCRENSDNSECETFIRRCDSPWTPFMCRQFYVWSQCESTKYATMWQADATLSSEVQRLSLSTGRSFHRRSHHSIPAIASSSRLSVNPNN